MIHLKASRYTIHPKPLIDKHIMLLKNLSDKLVIDDFTLTRNRDHQPVIVFNKTVNAGGTLNIQVRLMRSVHVDTMISVARSEVDIIVYIGAIPNSMKLSAINLTDLEKLRSNIKKITHGMAADEVSMMAHEATHMIDLPKHSGKYSEGAETLSENFENNNWLEINALLNEVVYCFPEAINSYDDFVKCFMDETINYGIQDKKATFYTSVFKPAVESILA